MKQSIYFYSSFYFHLLHIYNHFRKYNSLILSLMLCKKIGCSTMMSTDPKIKSCSRVVNFIYFYFSLSNCPMKLLGMNCCPFYFLLPIYNLFYRHWRWVCTFFMEMDKVMLLMKMELGPWICCWREFAIETVSSRTQFLMNKPLERRSNPIV